MIPTDLLAALGLSASEIADSALFAPSLAKLFGEAGGNTNPAGAFFRFINSWVREIPGSTRQSAAVAYRQAKYWANLGQYLGTLDPNAVLDPRLARIVQQSRDDFIEGQNYGYQIKVTVTFTDTGDQREFGFWVYRTSPSTSEGLNAQAWEQMMHMFNEKSKPQSEGGNRPEFWVTYQTTDFIRYEQA